MMIISDVVIGTETVLVSFDFFDEDDDDVDTAVSIPFSPFTSGLWLDDDVLMVLISSSDR